jgi:peroxiredoxin
MRNFWLIILLGFCVVSCNHKKENVTIRGSFKEFHPLMIYLKELTRNGIIGIDSSAIDEKGEFVLHARVDNPTFYILWIPHSRGINLLTMPGDRIRIYINSGNFDIDYTVEGSVESRRISKLVQQQHKTLDQITELTNKFEEIRGAPDFAEQKANLDSLYFIIVKQHKKFSEDFINENPCSMVNLMALDQQLGKTKPVFDIKEDFRIYEIVDSCLSALYPSSEIVINLNRKVVASREELKTEPGARAPEIALPDTSGKVISLQSLKGTYVLLVFWASWCSECRDQSKNLVKIYRNKTGNFFQVYQVSLDKSKESWVAGITQDEYPWINVSDLKFWHSGAAETYRVREIPSYFLINPEGKILIRTIHFSEIEKELDEIR